MSRPRRIRLLVALVLALGAALIVATAVVLRPRIDEWRARAERRARLDRALQDVKASELLEFADEPDAVLAVVDSFLSRRPVFAPHWPAPHRRIVELHALSRAPHPRVTERLRACAADEKLSVEARFEALYLLDELSAPTFDPEPENSLREPLVRGTPDEIRAPLAALGFVLDLEDAELEAGIDRGPLVERIEDTPYRALVRCAQLRSSSLVCSGGKWRFVPRRSLERISGTQREGARVIGGAVWSSTGDSDRNGEWTLSVKGVLADETVLAPSRTGDVAPLRFFRVLAALNGWTEPRRSEEDPSAYETIRVR